MHRFGYIALVSILLFAQAAQAVHDVQHQTHTETELCQLFASSDHSSGMASETIALPVMRCLELGFVEYSNDSLKQTTYTLGSRGPPSL